jgi:hypothetical protein
VVKLELWFQLSWSEVQIRLSKLPKAKVWAVNFKNFQVQTEVLLLGRTLPEYCPGPTAPSAYSFQVITAGLS